MSSATVRAGPDCLRCSGQALVCLEHQGKTQFFECPSCDRQYAQRHGGPLTYRWPHPVGVVLYALTFHDKVDKRSIWRIASSLRKGRTLAELDAFTREIELELLEPTQQVRKLLDTRASEAECRAFLAAVVTRLRDADPPQP